MKTYYFAVSKKDLGNGYYKEAFEENLKKNFKNYDHMLGFVEGYGFGKIDIIDSCRLENWGNDMDILKYKYIYAVTTEE